MHSWIGWINILSGNAKIAAWINWVWDEVQNANAYTLKWGKYTAPEYCLFKNKIWYAFYNIQMLTAGLKTAPAILEKNDQRMDTVIFLVHPPYAYLL